MAKRKKKTKQRPNERSRRGAVEANLSWFEVAMGHDGLFRGGPDPVLLAGLYSVQGDVAKLLCRGLLRIDIDGPYPASVDGAGPSRDTELLSKDKSQMECLALLVVALEEDGGSDVRRVYADLERARFTMWNVDHREPTPYELAEWAATYAESSERVEVLVDGESLRERCVDDVLIGTTVSTFRHVTRGSHPRRLHFRSSDAKNDWTCEVSLIVR